jgi:hypothetical protein
MKALWRKLADKAVKMWHSFHVRRAGKYLSLFGLTVVDEVQLDRMVAGVDRALWSISTTGADVSQFKAHATHLYRSLRNNLEDANDASHAVRSRFHVLVNQK